jgi:putative ABC transport system permease protein
MLKSYFTTTFRFLWKNKAFSLINIAGLTLGTVCFLYIVLYVSDQFGYDRHFKRDHDIYRITFLGKIAGGSPAEVATCSPPIAPAMKKDFPEVEQYTRLVRADAFGAKLHLLQYKDKSIYEKEAAYVDSTFFGVFDFHFTEGNAETALQQPYSAVLAKPLANKLFGDQDPIGKIISMDDSYGRQDLKVTGVIDESGGKSHIHANLYMPMNSGGMGTLASQSKSWAGDNYSFSYVRLKPNADAGMLEKKLPSFLNRYGSDQLKTFGMEKKLQLQPIREIHTTAGYNHDEHAVSSSFLYLLLTIGLLIQTIACINFMNLSTAQASKRAKEVGVRKVIGAGKKDLIRQFIGESLLISFLSVSIAVPLLILLLPYLNGSSGAAVSGMVFTDYRLWIVILFIGFFTGLVAGSYPAFYLSAFRAIRIIKGNFTSHLSAKGIRRSLVVFQFVFSIALTSAIIVIYSQLKFMNEKDLGFDKNQKLIFSFYTNDVQAGIPSFTTDLRNLADVKAVSVANNYLGQPVPNSWEYSLHPNDEAGGRDTKMMFTDEFFMSTNGIHLLGGRDFRGTDSAKVLINETFARRLGLTPETAPGKRLYPKMGGDSSWFEIAGVMKDFNFNSLHDEISSFMLVYLDNNVKKAMKGASHVMISTTSHDYTSLLEKIETSWRSHFSALPFEYAFQDEAIQKQYAIETTMSHIIRSFTLMAIGISCLGLFGLAAFSTEQRGRELSLRKILGASVKSLVFLLTKDFLKLICVAFLIATPIAWWAMNTWLQGFAYRISADWWMFASAGGITLTLVFITIGFRTLSAAVASPVKSLRSE